MSSKIRIPHFLAVLLLCLTAAVSQAITPPSGPVPDPIPGMIHYQGRIAVNNVNFAGPTGLFKFALVNADGTETYWTSDGTATGEPASSLTLPVANGLYAVNLGDSNLGGMPPILPSVFQGRDDVRLRIWFDDGVNGNQLLAPDQRFASVPYAMVAGSVAPGAVTPGSIGLGSISGILGCQIINTEFPGGQPGLGAFVSIPGTSFVAIAGTVTDQSAPYSIVNVPAGTYQVRADSGRGKVQTQTVTVVAGQNTVADFSLLSPSCPDTDFDGYGDAGNITESCSIPYGISPICTDTDDSNPFIHPNATEYCDGVDNDVDGTVDEECINSICGNYYIEPGETCDDGNNANGDGCSPSCQIETATCGDGVPEFGEQCDDGNVTNGDGCSSACQIELSICGDGVLQPGEQCDDANTTPGDGCGASCQIECTLDSQCPSSSNVCQTSVCSSGTCTLINNSASCDDGNACTENDVCSSGTCNGIQKNCSDSNLCTTDLCNPTNGACYFVTNTASCNDGNACTVGDACGDGLCQSGSTPLNCDDNNPCTTDSCNPGVGCVHTPVTNGTSCDDNSLCTTGDTCQAGVCTGLSVICPGDSNPCTTEACDPSTGCYQSYNTAPCDDGNLCTVGDSCSAGICGGAQKNCSDGNVCTTDSCNPTNGACSYATNTASCSDGNPCTTGDICSAGICQPGTGACFAGVTCSGDGSGGFICGPCPSGYSGNGVTCVDTDSCAPNPCFAGVSCTDTPAPGNGFTCGPCPTGYSGDGVTCTDVNSCEPNPCFTGVSCTDTPAPGIGYSCGPCPSGYTGDGITCVPQ